MINKPASETTALVTFIIVLALIIGATALHGCNSVKMPDVKFSTTTTIYPDGRVSVEEAREVKGGSAKYFISDSRSKITAKKTAAGDIELSYGRDQSVNETLGKGFDALKAIAEAAP